MKRPVAAVAVFAAAFAAYLAAAYPAIAPRDSSDLAAAAMTLGVAHPPGYPFYSMLGRAWLTLLPWGNPAYRLNVLSALAGAAAAAGLFIYVRRRAGTLAGAASAALWAASAPLIKFSLMAESYSLQALFAVVLLILAEGPRETILLRARLSGLALGLGLVNHQSLLFLIPGLLWLWRLEAARHDVRPVVLIRAAVVPLAAGLALYVFLWIRLGSLQEAFATVLRLRYGTGTLYAGLARPATLESMGALLAHAARGTAEAVSWPAALAALAGGAFCWRVERRRFFGLALVGLGGALFILLSRFDSSDWVAREVLEPAFVLPTLALAIFFGEVFSEESLPSWAAPGAAALAAALFLGRAGLREHRDDFLAYDYVRDLRRAVPPGASLLLAGDTTSFGLRWLGLFSPESIPRETADAPLIDAKAWLQAREGRGDFYVTGLGLDFLRGLGLAAPSRPLAPEGLVQRVGSWTSPALPPSVLRRPRAWARDDSYARNVRISYAFSSWLAARLLQERGAPEGDFVALDLSAVILDPQDYWLE